MAPDRYYHVSQTQLSVARHYGGCTVNGVEYVYDPTTDTLTRKSLACAETKAANAKRLDEKRAAKRRARVWSETHVMPLFGEPDEEADE